MPVELLLPPTHEAARNLHRWLTELMAQPDTAVFASRQGEIELAVHEIIANVIDHASATGEITVTARTEQDVLVVAIRDDGTSFASSEYRAPTDGQPQVRGYGLMIVDQLASSVNYTRCDHTETNLWTVTFGRSTPTSSRPTCTL